MSGFASVARKGFAGALRRLGAAGIQRGSARFFSSVTPIASRAISVPLFLSSRQANAFSPFAQSRGYATKGSVVAFNLADIGEGITEVELVEWFVKEGDLVEEYDKLCEVQSDKAKVEITSKYGGKILKLHHSKGDIANVGKPLVDIELTEDSEDHHEAAAAAPSEEPAAEAVKEEAPAARAPRRGTKLDSDGKPLATPAVRRLARENNVDLAMVIPSGKDGRITKSDVLDFLAGKQEDVVEEATESSTASSGPARASSIGEDTVIPVRGLMRTMVKTMTAANNIPHFGYCDEYEMTEFVDLRNELKPLAEKEGIKMSYMPLLLKSMSLALSQYPVLNSQFKLEENELIMKASHNIGVAVDTPQGLIVPNIKGVQDMSIMDIAKDLNRLMGLAKEGKLSSDDLAGGTFSVSNIGAIGGTYAKPVVVPTEVAIVALGKMQTTAKWVNGEFVPVPKLYASFSADHRVVDGATMANFSNLWKYYIEHPQAMLSAMR
mmetsp:Transcript_28135/g.71722  ORF Transcript_28135/g.71722 Transcript_28135/m.71722 type:complete len:493 (-) Transcript_28135:190-1668(-)